MAKQPIQMSPREIQVREIIKCGKDPIHFIKKYAKIQHPDRGTIPFETYDFQDECIKAFVEHKHNIVLKSRQLGLSTLCAAYATWLAIFHKDKNVLVVATKLPTAMNFIKKVQVILNNLPKWLLMTKVHPTNQAIVFTNGSQIKAVPTSPDAGRSEALSLLIVDEAAWIRDFDDLWTGLSPTISTGGSAIILSTPNGVGGQYYKLWQGAEANQNGFNPIRIMWDQHPEHDQQWFDNETKSLSRKRISQEFLCDFVASGDTFLQPVDLEAVRTAILQPLERVGPMMNVWVWGQPIPGRQYAVSADVARGDAHDFSAFHVIDTESCEVAVEYMGKIPPEKYADLLAEWGHKYNDAMIIPENNTFGYFVNVRLRDTLDYKQLYYQNRHGNPFAYADPSVEELPGFKTDKNTRVQILTKLEELIRNRVLKTYSQRLYDQLQAFIWTGNKAMASKDSFDDLVMSLAIGCWFCEGNSNANQQAAMMQYAILNATTKSAKNTDQMPGGVNSVKALVNPHIRGLNQYNVHKPRDPASVMHADASDFSWLLR